MLSTESSQVKRTPCPRISTVGSATHPLIHYVAKEIRELMLIGNTQHHPKNSEHFIEKIRSFQLEPTDILISPIIIHKNPQ